MPISLDEKVFIYSSADALIVFILAQSRTSSSKGYGWSG